jgi:hypothetical protein
MSNNNASRRRIDGHPGVYRVGKGGDRYQARYRDGVTGRVVSRTFETLEEAEAHRAARVGYTYTVRALVNGQFEDAWPVVPVADETAATWPEMQEYVEEARAADDEPTAEELRRYALHLALADAAETALRAMTSDAEALRPITDGAARTATITIKIVRNRADELDPGVRAHVEGLGPRRAGGDV